MIEGSDSRWRGLRQRETRQMSLAPKRPLRLDRALLRRDGRDGCGKAAYRAAPIARYLLAAYCAARSRFREKFLSPARALIAPSPPDRPPARAVPRADAGRKKKKRREKSARCTARTRARVIISRRRGADRTSNCGARCAFHTLRARETPLSDVPGKTAALSPRSPSPSGNSGRAKLACTARTTRLDPILDAR